MDTFFSVKSISLMAIETEGKKAKVSLLKSLNKTSFNSINSRPLSLIDSIENSVSSLLA